MKKNGKMYRVRVQYAFKGKKWVPTGKKYWPRVKWSWRKAYKKKKRHLFRLRVMYAYHKKRKKWLRTRRQHWPLVQWRWRKVTKIKKGLLYRLRKMYVYSRTAKKWFRTRQYSWRRIKRKEGSASWMWVGEPKKGRNGRMVRQRVLVVWKGNNWVTTEKKYWRCWKECGSKQRNGHKYKWKWGAKTMKKNGKMYRQRVLYARKGNKWVPTGKTYWRPTLVWKWGTKTTFKNGKKYRQAVQYTLKGDKYVKTRKRKWRRVRRRSQSRKSRAQSRRSRSRL
jgi:hypothetical protein